MDTKKKDGLAKSKTLESNTQKPPMARASLFDAIEVANATGRPYDLYELLGPITPDNNEGQELTLLVL